MPAYSSGMRRSLLFALAVLVAACGGDDSAGTEADGTARGDTTAVDTGDAGADDTAVDDAAPDGADDTAVELTASWRGVTPDTIHIGVAGIDAESVKDFGVELDIVAPDKAYRAFAAAYNAAGGAHGRMVQIHAELFLPVGTVDSERACTVLTEDQEIFIATGQMLNDAPLCFHRAPRHALRRLVRPHRRARRTVQRAVLLL